MPWVAAEAWVGDIQADGTVAKARRVAGGPDESVFQPSWSPDGDLYFVSDRGSGWWNLYRERDGAIEPLAPMEAEFGQAHWNFAMSTYAFDSAERIVCCFVRGGVWRLARLDLGPSTSIRWRSRSRASRSSAPARDGPCSWAVRPPKRRPSSSSTSPPGLTGSSGARPSWAMTCGPIFPLRGRSPSRPRAARRRTRCTTHHSRPASQRRPERRRRCWSRVNGGPTASASSTLSLAVQYWTSRGIGVLDVNYRGSTGYGRPYRLRLARQWGILDVQDCVHGARHLVEAEGADPGRLMISGGSAGGYTTLCALTPAGEKTFSAGASYYGVSDLAALARDTHKFESRYPRLADRTVSAGPADLC